MRRAAAPALLFFFAAFPATAQVSIAGVRDVAFGFLTLGVQKDILPSDPLNSGQWTITAPVGQRVQIRLTLPNQLLGPSGATLPVYFKNEDAFVQGTWTGAITTVFNPGSTLNFRFTGGTQAIVRLGGSITPATNQRTGPYTNSAICTLTIF